MLQLLVVIIEHGYNDGEIDFSKLIPLLFDLLDGSKDYVKVQPDADTQAKQKNEQEKKKAEDATAEEDIRESKKKDDDKDDKMKDLEMEREDPTKFKNGGRYAYKEGYHFYCEIKHW